MNHCGETNQKTLCPRLVWQIECPESPGHITLHDNRLLVSSAMKMHSYYAGKRARHVWSKPFKHRNDFQAHLGKKLHSFDSAGFLAIYDFWTGAALMDVSAPKDILEVSVFENNLALFCEDSITIFDTHFYQWTDSIERSISKAYFGESAALVADGNGNGAIVSLGDFSQHNILLEQNRKILDAKYFNGNFACLLDNGKMVVLNCQAQEIQSFSLYADYTNILHFDDDFVCISDGYRLRGYFLASCRLAWSDDFARITASAQKDGLLCIGQADGVVMFVGCSNGEVLAAFEGTSPAICVTPHKNLWLLGFEDGNVFALSLAI